MLRIFNLQTKHFLIIRQIKTIPSFVFNERDQIIPQGRNLLAFTKHMHQGLINFFTKMTKRRITSAYFSKKFIGANSFMENLEIKCSQLCFNATVKVIIMNNTPINIIFHIQSIIPKQFCITWTILNSKDVVRRLCYFSIIKKTSNNEPNYNTCNRMFDMCSTYCENFIYISLSIAMWHVIFENWRITKMSFQRERSIP